MGKEKYFMTNLNERMFVGPVNRTRKLPNSRLDCANRAGNLLNCRVHMTNVFDFVHSNIGDKQLIIYR